MRWPDCVPGSACRAIVHGYVAFTLQRGRGLDNGPDQDGRVPLLRGVSYLVRYCSFPSLHSVAGACSVAGASGDRFSTSHIRYSNAVILYCSRGTPTSLRRGTTPFLSGNGPVSRRWPARSGITELPARRPRLCTHEPKPMARE
jgi:hypothetical protein